MSGADWEGLGLDMVPSDRSTGIEGTLGSRWEWGVQMSLWDERLGQTLVPGMGLSRGGRV